MAQFNNLTLTDAGAALIAASIAGGKSFSFSSVKLGSGTQADAKTATSLGSACLTLGIKNTKKLESGAVQLVAEGDNSGLSEGFAVNEIGVFAKLDGNTAETLYMYATAEDGKGGYMADSSVPLDFIQYTVVIAVSADADIALSVTPGVYATVDDLETAIEASETSSADTYLSKTDAGTTYITKTNAAATYLPLSGGTLTGALTVKSNITATGSVTASGNITGAKVYNAVYN